MNHASIDTLLHRTAAQGSCFIFKFQMKNTQKDEEENGTSKFV